MATTTPNFGWAVPTSSDLVKNGATAIETLGDAIDASMVDLKGGTTGQVLSKATNTDMDFSWITPSAGSSGSSNVAGKNGVLNSNFSIWQRGTSVAFGAYTYTADRWQCYNNGTVATATQQVTGDTTNLPNIQYCARIQRTAGSAITNAIQVSQSFETINSIQYAGKTVTLSFYARKGANYSPTSSLLNYTLNTGTGTDQRVLAGYTGNTAIINQNATLTTTWQRFSYSAAVGATATEIGMAFNFNPTGTAGANDYFEVTGVQLEIAASASDYSPNAATFQGELAACQRYYSTSYKTGATVPTAGGSGGLGLMFSYPASASSGWKLGTIIFPQRMRTSPTVTIYSYSAATTNMVSDATGADVAANSGTPYLISEFSAYVYNNSGGTISHSQGGFICHFAASAEL